MNDSLVGLLIQNLKKEEATFNGQLILIPKSKEVSIIENGNTLALTNESTIAFINVKNDEMLLEDLNEYLESLCGIKLRKVKFNDSNAKFIKKRNISEFLNSNSHECYNLEIKNGQIVIYSPNEQGLFYGIQTLIQIIKNAYLNNISAQKNRFIFPEITIRDVPDIKIRGIAQDISRGQIFTVDNAKRIIKILSHYKMNFYCAYIEDVFAHPKHPKIGKDRGALTPEEIKEIDNFAKARYIEFVPIFECLGHVDNILQHKEYENLGEFPGAHCLNISNPKIYEFLNDYISELSKSFSTNYFHIGCDESFDIGRYNSKNFIKEYGKSKVLVDFYEKVYHIAKENGNDYIIMYDDIVRKNEGILKNLNKDIILMYWDYNPKKSFPDLEKLLDAGYKVIASPSMLNWQRNFPDNKNASKNIINFIKAAHKNRSKGCLGVLTSTWGDMRYYSFRENEIFGAILNGALAWTTLNFDYNEFKANYGFLFYGIDKQSCNKFNEMFTLLSKSASVYYRISVLIPPLFFTYFFKHPFPFKNFKPPFENYESLGDLADKCLAIYNELKSKVIFEIANFEYIELGAELAKYLKEKIDISQKVSDTLNKSELSDITMQNIISDLKYIKDKMIYLRDKFEKLWLRAAKRPCLDSILKLFNFLIKEYDTKISQINKRIYFEDPYLRSEWIWTADAANAIEPCYFRKRINIHHPIKKAIIQGIANNHMKIYINNEFVGQVLGRYSMSILPIVSRVKAFDITRYLKEGKNIISIEAYNYDNYKGAINIYGQILLKNDSILEIITNDTWNCYAQNKFNSDDWLKLEFKEDGWRQAKSYGRPPNLNGDIFKPNLLNGEISDTQDYFGIEGYMSNFTEEYDQEKLEHMIKVFRPYGN